MQRVQTMAGSIIATAVPRCLLNVQRSQGNAAICTGFIG